MGGGQSRHYKNGTHKDFREYISENKNPSQKWAFSAKDVQLAARASHASYDEDKKEIRDHLGLLGSYSIFLEPHLIKSDYWNDDEAAFGIWNDRKCLLTVHQQTNGSSVERTLIIAFRGTEGLTALSDWAKNVNVKQQSVDFGKGIKGKVHDGFYGRFQEYQEQSSEFSRESTGESKSKLDDPYLFARALQLAG